MGFNSGFKGLIQSASDIEFVMIMNLNLVIKITINCENLRLVCVV